MGSFASNISTQKATREIWGEPVNSCLFRQIYISITEKQVVEVQKPFN